MHVRRMVRSRWLVGLMLALAFASAAVAPTPARAAASIPIFNINGTGFGHGVGLSQLGALEAAKQGRTAEEIIKHYYTDVDLKTIATYRVNVELWPSSTATNRAKNSWTLRPGYVGGSLLVNGTEYPDNRYVFTAKDGVITMTWTVGSVPKAQTFTAEVTVKMGAPYDKTDLIQVVDRSGGLKETIGNVTYSGRNNVRYRGYMVLSVPAAEQNQVRLQNSVDVEGYLRGVLPRELGSFFSPLPAASEAQAIVARSYARLGRSSLYTTTRSQVYGGHSYYKDETARNTSKHTALEQAGSSAAITSTAGQHMTHNGSVVRGYFSASNGPVTANVEDIWGTRYNYLRSVKDPYFKATDSTVWKFDQTGLQLAAKLAGRGYGPSGAGETVWVDDVEIFYGTGGHANGARIDWSNGTVTTLTRGEQVMLGFGLKSAQVKISRSNITPVTYANYEDGSSAFGLVGPWKWSKISGNSSGALRTTMTKGSYFELKFKGEGARWIGPKAASYGRAKVYLNGTYVKTINLYSVNTVRQQVLYEVKGLDPTKTHTLKVVVTTKSSGGYGYIGLDRVDVRNGKAVFPPFKTYQESSSYIKRTGTWKSSTSAANFSGRAYFTRTLNASATMKFKGGMVRWVGYTTTDGGRAKVYLNGVYQETVSMKSSSTKRKIVLYEKTALDPTKTHTLKIVNIKAAGSSRAGKMTIDQMQVRNGVAVK